MPKAILGDRLHRVTEATLAFLDLDSLLAELLDRTREVLHADTAAILLVEEGGEVLVPRAARGLEGDVEGARGVPIGTGFASEVAARREPVVIEDLDSSPIEVRTPVLREQGIRALVGVRLLVEGELIGVLHVGTRRPRGFDDEDVGLLSIVADRAAVAIDRARLFEAERGSRIKAEAAATRLKNIQRVTEAALGFLDLESLLGELLDRITEILDADTAAILLVEDDGETLAARAAKGLEREVEEGFRLPIGAGFAGRVAATREPVVIEDLHDSPIEVVNPILRQSGVRSLLGVPLLVERELIGVLHVGTLHLRRFRDDDTELLRLAADRAALAIQNARLVDERRISHSLQRALLPRELPRIPGLALAARYEPASTASAVGGDWYDVIPLNHPCVGVAVGDVAGKGVEAAAFMGELRNALRVFAYEGRDPGEALKRLDSFVERQARDQMATLVYGVLDLESWTMEIARAGHPLPLLASADGSTTFVAPDGGTPLGTGLASPPVSHRVVIQPRSTLLLYTDGLIERRGKRLADGERALSDAAAAGPLDPESVCARVVMAMTSAAALADDLALVAIQRVAIGDVLALDVPARAEELSWVRTAVGRWMAEGGASKADIAAMALACSEACANTIEHAYGPGDAELRIEGEIEPDSVTITVSDRGRWRKPREDARGRGIALMKAFADQVEIAPADDGTTVRLRRRIEG
jgi:GAF domain-containing protein/anti-sigma regulatory factor (Ser/Thr protein kinase)